MAANTKIELSCDLCKWPAKVLDSKEEAKKAGWLVIGQESYYLDRDFFDSHICPSCSKKIKTQLIKESNPYLDRELRRIDEASSNKG